jgi:hypothetical protein
MENKSQKSLNDSSHSPQGCMDEGISPFFHHQPAIPKYAGMFSQGMVRKEIASKKKEKN